MTSTILFAQGKPKTVHVFAGDALYDNRLKNTSDVLYALVNLIDTAMLAPAENIRNRVTPTKETTHYIQNHEVVFHIDGFDCFDVIRHEKE